jgi:NAD(P)-dependent dehydrogenase (short-subunit alcohol dehydrogenase family)
MSKKFEGKVAVVVGAAQGIGAATARRLAAEGCKTIVADVQLGLAEAVAHGIARDGGMAIALHADLSDETTLQRMFEQVTAAFGGIDLLANIGYEASNEDLDIVSTPQRVWDRVYDVNFMGYVRCCRLAIPLMVQRGGGAIVNCSSGVAFYAERVRTAYGTSKAAIAALTRSIAVQYGHQGVRANAVAPGAIATESVLSTIGSNAALFQAAGRATPAGRVGRPEDLASVISFLLSNDADYLTGQTISVDGGRLIAGPGIPAASGPRSRD